MVHLCFPSVSKSAWNMQFVSLLQLWILFTAAEDSLVKTIGEEPDVTPICANQTYDVIIFIICNITTRSGGQECQLGYNSDKGKTDSSCDSRITLLKQNERMFLHLNKLTPADNGSYNCECSFNGGTHFVKLDVTVNSTEKHEVDNTSPTPMYILIALTSVTVIVIGIAVTFAVIRKIIHRKQSQTLQRQSLQIVMAADIEPYGIFTQTNNILYSSSLRQTNNMLYSTVQAHTAQTSITC